MTRLRAETLTGTERRLFFIRSVDGGGGPVLDDARAQAHDDEVFRTLELFLREDGLEESTGKTFEVMTLLYPLIMQILVDRLDG